MQVLPTISLIKLLALCTQFFRLLNLVSTRNWKWYVYIYICLYMDLNHNYLALHYIWRQRRICVFFNFNYCMILSFLTQVHHHYYFNIISTFIFFQFCTYILQTTILLNITLSCPPLWAAKGYINNVSWILTLI